MPDLLLKVNDRHSKVLAMNEFAQRNVEFWIGRDSINVPNYVQDDHEALGGPIGLKATIPGCGVLSDTWDLVDTYYKKMLARMVDNSPVVVAVNDCPCSPALIVGTITTGTWAVQQVIAGGANNAVPVGGAVGVDISANDGHAGYRVLLTPPMTYDLEVYWWNGTIWQLFPNHIRTQTPARPGPLDGYVIGYVAEPSATRLYVRIPSSTGTGSASLQVGIAS